MRRRRGGARTLAAVAALAVGLGLVAWATDVFGELELDTVDARFAIRGTEAPPDDIVIVEIDDSTFAELQERFPFPRSMHGEVVDELRRDGADVIAYDVQFTEPTSPAQDNRLISAVERAPRVVLSTTEVDRDGSTNVFGGDDVLRAIGARAGNTILAEDRGGVVRRIPVSHQGLESFAAVAVELERGGRPAIAGVEDGTVWVDFHGPPGTFETVPFWRVHEGEFGSGTFEGKTVIVGATAPSLQDVHATSTTGENLMSGPEIQANAISTIRRGAPLSANPGWLDALLVALFGLIAPLASLRLAPLAAFGVAAGAGLAYLLAVQLAFDAGTILPVVYPLGTLALSGIATLTAQYLAASFERRRTRELFARFVPESVVDRVLDRADDELRLGGVQIEGTILFSDVRGFTTFSETHAADRVVEVLNRYLSEMSDAIFEHGGTITTYIGDGIMAVFGAPIEQEDHADRAIATARTMLDEKLPRFNAWIREQGLEEFRIGVGINSGLVMTGNVGSDRRMEYTAIGDAVNTAARLEGMTKGTGHDVFVSETTRAALRGAEEGLVFVDELAVRGRRSAVKVWSLADDDDRGRDEPTQEALGMGLAGPAA